MMFKAKKSLAQHFLRNRQILRKIVLAGKLQPGETVVEIGPGLGHLTRELLRAGVKVIAVEKDEQLCFRLQQEFGSQPECQIVCGDILSFNPANYLQNRSYKVIGNIPYYLTGKILELALERWRDAGLTPERVILTVQKQVAEKLTAQPPRLTVLGVINQLLAKIRVLFFLSRAEFTPSPKVDSCVIELIPRAESIFAQYPGLKQFIKTGFSQPRKYLLSVLTEKLNQDKAWIKQKLAQLGLVEKVRPGALTPEQWFKLFQLLNS